MTFAEQVANMNLGLWIFVWSIVAVIIACGIGLVWCIWKEDL